MRVDISSICTGYTEKRSSGMRQVSGRKSNKILIMCTWERPRRTG